MNKMNSSHLQKQLKRNKVKLVAGIAVAAALILVLVFVVNSSAPNMTVAMGMLVPLVLVLFAVGAFLVLRIMRKAEFASFDEGMHVVMESVPMLCCLYDKDNNIKYCNDKAHKLFGYNDRQEYAENYAESFPEFQPDGSKSDDMAIKFIDEVIREGSSTIDWYQKASNGELIPLHLICVRAHFQGEWHMLEFTRDRREELETEQQEAAIKEQMQAVLDASPMLCVVADDRGNFIDVNKEAENLFNIPDKHLFIKNYESFLPPHQPDGTNSVQKISEQMKEILKKGPCRYEFTYRRHDGVLIHTEEIATPVKVGGKTILICYTRDMREFYANKEKDALVQQNIQILMEQLNSNVSEQSAAVTESAAAIEQMVANIQSVTNALTKNAEQVSELRTASEVGHSSITEVVSDMRGIAAESDSLLQINSVMSSIASQTNLLSMNAAIEAAHAGESGRGFAVVADEIRKLAESSSKQSKTIGAVLKTIKASIDKITKSAEQVLARFDTIDGGIETVAEQERGVLNAMEEQRHGSEQVLRAIGQVSDITQRVKNEAEQMIQRQQAVTSR
jgi:PAS domain S-box-containing protein